jgi:hypothetical protein
LSISVARRDCNPQVNEQAAGFVNIIEQALYRRSLLFGGMKSP